MAQGTWCGSARLASAAGIIILAAGSWTVIDSQSTDEARRQRFTAVGTLDREAPLPTGTPTLSAALAPGEAPTGFDDKTNGFSPQGPAFDTIDEDNVVALRSFNDNRFIFEEAETIADGLGPTYNAQGCRECHQNVVTGGASQIAEHRTGRMTNGQFFESQGGSLVHSRATNPQIRDFPTAIAVTIRATCPACAMT